MSSQTTQLTSRLHHKLSAPKCLAALAVLRTLFGAMMVFSLCRFMANGWIERLYAEPRFFFKYPGFSWASVGSTEVMYILYSIVALASAAISIGLFYRVAVIIFCLGFCYIQLLDVTLYLNHYYLVCLISGIMIFLPLNGMWSADVALGLRKPRTHFPAWATYLLRLQVGIVYFYAAIAKFQPDWLFYGQPLSIWLHARTETWLIGPLVGLPCAPLVMSWAGFFYDLTVWIFLLIRQTRPLAYMAVILFHLSTGLLFNIGMFPVIMIVVTTVFFEPCWPQRWLSRGSFIPHSPAIGSSDTSTSHPLTPWPVLSVVTLYALLQLSIPLRAIFIPGDVLWNEQGMRFAWKVMVRSKGGDIYYRIRKSGDTRDIEISALKYLTWRQFSDMCGQPDLILQLGKHIGSEYEHRWGQPVEVRVDAWVSLNGRPPARLVDPTMNIQHLTDSGNYSRWLMPAPNTPPLIMYKASTP
ncbi:MAG: HTTM domain-containing protein [Myxococcales bacterium]|nr:HTTM domain-containing protein [Myxococcales bacterium]